MVCDACKSGRLKRGAGLYHYTESGLPNIYLKNVDWQGCPKCGGRRVVIPRMGQLHRCIAWRLVTQPALLSGDEITYLRKMLRVNQGEFAKALNVTQVTLSRWEHGRKHSRESDLLIRMVYIGCKNDEYTEALHKELWKLLSQKLPDLQSKHEPDTITIDPDQCDPAKEVADLLAFCTAISSGDGQAVRA
jgi:putative transcriptional regulator